MKKIIYNIFLATLLTIGLISNFVLVYAEDNISSTYSKITVNYLDVETNEAIRDAVILNDNEYGKEYDVTSIIGIEIEGYTFNNSEGETKGILNSDVVINCYYLKTVSPLRHNVIVQYVDKITDKEIKESVVLSGAEYIDGAEYNVADKVGIEIEGYTYDNTEGEMSGILTRDVTIVCYYNKEGDVTSSIEKEELNSDVLGDKIKNNDKSNIDNNKDELDNTVLKDVSKDKKIKTSDEQNILVYLMMGVVAVLGVSVLIKRKKNN